MMCVPELRRGAGYADERAMKGPRMVGVFMHYYTSNGEDAPCRDTVTLSQIAMDKRGALLPVFF